MLQKSILSKPKWGGTSSRWEGFGAPGPTVATALATGKKNDTQVANFANSRYKRKKPYFKPGLPIQT